MKRLAILFVVLAFSTNLCFSVPGIGSQAGKDASWVMFEKSEPDSKLRWFDFIIIGVGFFIIGGK